MYKGNKEQLEMKVLISIRDSIGLPRTTSLKHSSLWSVTRSLLHRESNRSTESKRRRKR